MPDKTTLFQILDTDGLPDYAVLASDEAIALYPEMLTELLEEAKRDFAKLLAIPADEVNFENTIIPFLDQDAALTMLFTFVNNLNATDASDRLRTIIADFQPHLVAYADEVAMHPELYRRVKAISKGASLHDPEQQRATKLILRDMEFAGVHLAPAKKKRLAAINTRLASLGEDFSSHVLDDRKRFFWHCTDTRVLGEMPEEDIAMAKAEAKQRKKSGMVFTLSPPSYLAIMKYCSDSTIRKKFWLANARIASRGRFDNRPIILEMLRLRAEKATIMGKTNYADYVLTQRMAPDTATVLETLDAFAAKALPKAESELAELQSFAGKKHLKLWDTAYYAEQLLHQTFTIDEKRLRPYFELEAVLQGMFTICGRLFDLSFSELKVPSYAPDVRTFAVFCGKRQIAYYILDPYARPSKRGGAWCNDLRARRQTRGKTRLPIAINVTNFAKHDPCLLTHRDVETLFHEFGHALHLILGETKYANLSGFHTEWDFVELPSQLLENWTWEGESLALFAKHYRTDKPLPAEMIDKLQASRTFLKGLFLLRQNEFGFLDFLLHIESPPADIAELEARTLAIANRYSVIPKPKSYRMYASFSHIFGGGYAAGYYSYLWAEILEAEVFALFRKHGVLDPKTGQRYREKILARGASRDGLDLFIDLVGHPPSPDALLTKLGIVGA